MNRIQLLTFLLFLVGVKHSTAQENDTLFVRYDLHNSDSVNYITDTLFRSKSFGPHFLFETQWITNSPNQLRAIGYNLFPIEARSNCAENGIEGGENSLVKMELNDSSLVVQYRVIANCCYEFLCDMNIQDSNTINLTYMEYGTICGCICSHDLFYEIKIDHSNEEFSKNFQKLKWVSLNGELKKQLLD